MFLMAISGASDAQLIQAGWLLFALGYLAKYLLDRRFAFSVR
jgi:hypothetical protein